MAAEELDRARIAHITRYVKANTDRIGEAAKALLVDDDGKALPFVLLLPMGEGTQTIANLGAPTVAGMLRALATQLEREELAKMFAHALTEGMARMLTDAAIETPPEDDTTKNGKAH